MPTSKKRKGAHKHHEHTPQADDNRPWITQPNSNGPITHSQQAAAGLAKSFKRRGV